SPDPSKEHDMATRQCQINAYTNPPTEANSLDHFLAVPRDSERFRYSPELEAGTEHERCPELEFSNFIQWRCLSWKIENQITRTAPSTHKVLTGRPENRKSPNTFVRQLCRRVLLSMRRSTSNSLLAKS